MLDKIKSKITNPYLKDNFSLENIANFFANYVSGNNFVNNLEVKELAELNKVEIKDVLKVKNEADIDTLSFNKLKSRALTIDDNEITFDPEAVLKLKRSNIAFKVKDVFEVITFMKYIVKICGSKLEKCDFNSLLKNHTANRLMQLVASFENKQKSFIEKEKDKVVKIQQENLAKLKNKVVTPTKPVEKKNLRVEPDKTPKFKESIYYLYYLKS
jgi:hypothetical protein